ncbi:MAG TPA: CusA/CzcA family heavy metal efflux RND transporter [Bryobacteraceae bacterium]|nr:CusA/CzcA family heavy metal efflux RND transporter [Bryobacteraceae bacterium]
MIRGLVDFALGNRLLMLAIGIILFAWGVYSFLILPVEAYPDVADTYVNIITQWPGRAAEEVEQQVTIPIEAQMSGVAHLTHLRSISEFGLSSVTLIFDDTAENLLSRQQVLEKLTLVTLPPNVNPVLGPDYSPVGQLYFYTLASSNPLYDNMELKSLQDWVLVKQLKSVPDVVDVSSFGGITREYQVQVDPARLVEYGLSIGQVEQALAANNVNAGGSFLEHGPQAFNIRAVGLMNTTGDIGQTVLKAQNGTPVRVRDLGFTTQGPKIRLGRLGKAIRYPDGRVVDYDDVVEGIVLLRKGAPPDAMLEALHQKIAEINGHLLPAGVKIVPHLDRSDLVQHTKKTVLHNLSEGIILVVIVLFLLLGNARSALIVACTIPFSLLFAAILLDLRHIPANLLSLGALDFGMVVHGSCVMVENILRHVSHSAKTKHSLLDRIAFAVHEVQRPVFYSILIIITSYLPIFTLQRVEGRLFRPMAWTVAFALLGALLFALLIAPVLTSFVFRPGMKEWRNPLLTWVTRFYRHTIEFLLRRSYIVLAAALLIVGATVYLFTSGVIGSEFLPHLDEGAVWARGILAPSTGPSESIRIANQARLIFAGFPEVTQVVSQVGRPDDGTDVAGFFNTEYFVDLKPREQWRPQFKTKDELISAMDEKLRDVPGVMWNFSQPIADNMEEAVSGVKGQLAIKIFGTDLKKLEETGDQIIGAMSRIPGVADLGIFRVIGQPNVNLVVNREKADRFGINVADIQDAIETAAGGKAVSQILKGEARYDLVVRYQEPYRRTIPDIANIRILAPSGERVSLGQLCDIKVEDGASQIFRETNSRYVAIKYSVVGRDLGSTVTDAMNAVEKNVKLPQGYHLEWAGEFESQKRANKRLAFIVPATLLAIFLILYSMFGSFKWSSMILLNLTTVPIGGLLALLITGTHFSVSSGVGFLALFGVAVQVGVILLEHINQLRARGNEIGHAIIEGAVLRLRPILMTMLVATLGLVPAALSHGIGSDSQRPFAIVIVGGLLLNLFVSIILLPVMYVWFARRGDHLPHAEMELAEE